MADEVQAITPQKEDINTPNKKKFGWGDVFKCALILVAIAVVAGGLLGVVNWLTYVDPDAAIMDKVAGVYDVDSSNITKANDMIIDLGTTSSVLAVYKASDADGKDVGYCYYTSGAKAKDGTIELLVYIQADGLIKDIEVYEQGETAGYFSKVEKANKSKYININVNEIQGFAMKGSKSEFKDGDAVVDAVSNATYTSSGYHNAIAVAVNAYKAYVGGAK